MINKVSPTILTPIRDQSLRAQAKTEIHRRIIQGDIVPGTTYRIADFVNQLEVSATPIREALQDLATDGLIQMLPNRGFQVPSLSNQDLDQLFFIRVLLEPPSVASATQLMDEKHIAILQSFADHTVAAAKKGDLYGFIEWDGRFHFGLLEPLNNPRLNDIVKRLREGTGLYRQSYVSGTDLLNIASDEHETVMRAVAQHDGTKAGDLMRHHLVHTHEMYKQRRSASAAAQRDGERPVTQA